MHQTAYELRIIYWSSDVCSSDLFMLQTLHAKLDRRQPQCPVFGLNLGTVGLLMNEWRADGLEARLDRKSGVEGKSVSVRVETGGGRIINKNIKKQKCQQETTNKKK